jgi:hypothetical protein
MDGKMAKKEDIVAGEDSNLKKKHKNKKKKKRIHKSWKEVGLWRRISTARFLLVIQTKKAKPVSRTTSSQPLHLDKTRREKRQKAFSLHYLA